MTELIAVVVVHLVVSVIGMAGIFVQVGRVLQRQDEHERRLNRLERLDVPTIGVHR